MYTHGAVLYVAPHGCKTRLHFRAVITATAARRAAQGWDELDQEALDPRVFRHDRSVRTILRSAFGTMFELRHHARRTTRRKL